MRQHKKRVRVTAPSVDDVIFNAQQFWIGLDTPVSLSCYLLSRAGEWDQLLRKSVSPLDYDDDLRLFQRDYQAVSLLKKSSFFRVATIDRRQAAKVKFWEAEDQCRVTNERLSLYSSGLLMPRDRRVHAVLHRARELIRRIIGENPNDGGLARSFVPRFGPGVTSSARGRVVHAQKYSSRLDVTPRLYPYYRSLIGERQRGLDVQLCAANRVTFVPKNALTDRTIAVEPTVNIYAQLGVGNMLRTALQRFGLNLDTQSDVNRRLAGLAYTEGLSTIDLSSASDTVSRELVWLLLPEGWANLLDIVRAPYGELDGVEFEYEKFSSMGNGSTFELETLIFYALALATGSRRERTSAFGDDIILERGFAPLLVDVLSFCGFTVNVEKSFIDGSFFESCGADYYRGELVTPLRWKDLKPVLWYKMVNDIARFAARSVGTPGWLDGQFLPAWLKVSGRIPRSLRLGVPNGYGDCGIIVPMDHSYVSALFEVRRNAWRFNCVTFRPTGHVAVSDMIGGLCSALDGHPTDENRAGFQLPRESGRWRKTSQKHYLGFGSWEGLGIWV